jgi:branched-chain amino acid transport system permease protein
MLVQILANGILSGCLYALGALGFGLIYTTTRTFHFAHGAIYTLSAYLFYTFYSLLEWPLWMALILTPACAALAGILVDQLVYLPLVRRGSSPLIRLLSSIGLYIVIVNFIAMIYGNETKVLSPGVQPSIRVGALVLTKFQLLALVSFVIFFALVVLVLRTTSLGRKIRALRDDPDLVSALGINPLKTRMMVFGLGSALAAITAMLSGLDVGIDPHIGLTATLTGAVALIIGGIGILEGAVFGALLLGLLQALAVWQISARWQDAVTFLILLFFLLFRPQGAFGRGHRSDEVTI